MSEKPVKLEKLKNILANLNPEELERVAKACGTTVAYLKEQISNGHRKASVQLAKDLVRELEIFGLTLADVRQDIYGGERAAAAR